MTLFNRRITEQELSEETKEKLELILSYANDFDVIQDFISGNSPVGQKLTELLGYVGAMSELKTQAKADFVNAINEVYGAVIANNTTLTSDLSTVKTQQTKNTTDIQSLNTTVGNAKKNSITGVSNLSLSERLDNDYKYLMNARTISNDILTPTSKTRFLAHRGFNLGAPENTLIGFNLAANAGFFGVETDIQCTQDGYWILHHDTTIDRMTNGTGNIKDMMYADILQYDIDAGNSVKLYPKMKIPTFEQFLKTCKKLNIIPVVEIKGSGYTSKNFDELIRIIRKHGFENKMIMISFTTSFLDEIRKRSYGIVLAPLIPIGESNLNYVKKLGNAMINPDNTSLSEASVEMAHQQGILVMTWTVNDYGRAKDLMDMGVDYITTDFLVGGGRL